MEWFVGIALAVFAFFDVYKGRIIPNYLTIPFIILGAVIGQHWIAGAIMLLVILFGVMLGQIIFGYQLRIVNGVSQVESKLLFGGADMKVLVGMALCLDLKETMLYAMLAMATAVMLAWTFRMRDVAFVAFLMWTYFYINVIRFFAVT